MIVSSLAVFCDMLRSQTGAHVILGFPGETEDGIYVWPWRFEESANMRNLPQNANPDSNRLSHVSINNIHVLVIVRPSLTIEGLSRLEAVYQAILDRPILDVGGRAVHIVMERLSPSDTTSLFMAASIPLTVCLNLVLRVTA